MEHKYWTTFAALMILAANALTSVALAEDPPKTWRRYDEKGEFDGTIREDPD